MSDYLYIVGTVAFTVYGQLITKWQVSQAGAFPGDWPGRGAFLVRLLLNPWVISSLGAAFLAALCWMAALTKFKLSYAYPFTSVGFALVIFLSAFIFREGLTVAKVLGVALVIAGIVVGSRG